MCQGLRLSACFCRFRAASPPRLFVVDANHPLQLTARPLYLIVRLCRVYPEIQRGGRTSKARLRSSGRSLHGVLHTIGRRRCTWTQLFRCSARTIRRTLLLISLETMMHIMMAVTVTADTQAAQKGFSISMCIDASHTHTAQRKCPYFALYR